MKSMEIEKMTRTNSLYKVSLVIFLLTQLLTAIVADTGPLLSIVWFVWIIICSYFTFLICTESSIKKNSFALIMLLFWVINLFSFFFSPKHVQSYLVEVDTLVYFKSITIALLSYFPFYYYSKQGFINQSNLKWFVIILFVVSVIWIYNSNNIRKRETFEENNVLNQAYLFVQLIPLVLIFIKRSHLYLLMALIGLLVLTGAKRGAILSMVFEMLVFFIYLLKEDPFGKKHRVTILFLVVIILSIGTYYLFGHEFVMDRLQNTGTDIDTSGEIRSERYLLLWSIIFDRTDVNNLIFGYGMAQTVQLGGGLAHQDWIEILINNGLIGFILYVGMILMCLLKIIRWNKVVPIVVKYALICCLIFWFLTATYSMVYASRDSCVFFVTLGIIDGFIRKGQKQSTQIMLKKVIV